MTLERLSRRARDDRGATAVLIAAAMVLIMGIAAVVIDGGFGFSERRQAQSGADFAALAALREAVSCGSSCSLPAAANNGAAEAVAVADANLPGRFAAADWTACADPSRPTEYSIVSTTYPCVSFTNNLDKARVHLPDDVLDTTFGAILGSSTITVGAEAEAGSTLNAATRLIPNTPLGATGSEACLFANQAPQAEDPCPGVSGFYGYIDLALYGDDDHGTPSACNNGDSNKRIAINLAKGGDHSVVTYDPGPPDPIVNDQAACPNTNEDINELTVQTGSTAVGITDGLINGVSGSINGQSITGSPGRIACQADPDPSDPYVWGCTSVRGRNLDHTGLWQFLVPGTCPAGTDTHAEMLTCLDLGTARFVKEIGDHPRFAAVPVFWTTPTGPGSFTIKEFLPVWIETLYFDCDANTCDTVHSPGETQPPSASCVNDPLADTRNKCWTDTSGPDRVEGMLAFTFDLGMLPAEITENFPASQSDRSYALTE